MMLDALIPALAVLNGAKSSYVSAAWYRAVAPARRQEAASWSSVPISEFPSSICYLRHWFHRMARMITKIEGIKTNAVNMVNIAKALARPAIRRPRSSSRRLKEREAADKVQKKLKKEVNLKASPAGSHADDNEVAKDDDDVQWQTDTFLRSRKWIQRHWKRSTKALKGISHVVKCQCGEYKVEPYITNEHTQSDPPSDILDPKV